MDSVTVSKSPSNIFYLLLLLDRHGLLNFKIVRLLFAAVWFKTGTQSRDF